MHKTIYLFVLALFFTSTAFAQITWEALNGPKSADGVQITAVDQSGRLFVRKNDELFTSTDNGDNWIVSKSGLTSNNVASIASIIVFPSGKVVARIGYDYYKYDSTANSWSLDIQLAFLGILSFDDQQRLWRIYGQEISYSSNMGQTFNVVLTGPQVVGWKNSMANYNNNNNLIAVSDGNPTKLYHFKTDGTFNLVKEIDYAPIYMDYNPFSGTAFMFENKNWRSTDGGLTWNEIVIASNPIYTTPVHIRTLFYESSTKLWAFAGVDGVFFSEDDGATWTPFLIGGNFANIKQFYRKSDGVLFASHDCLDDDFVRSIDGGQTWTSISEFFKYPSIYETIVAKNGILYAKNCGKYVRSTDGGQTWSPAMVFDSVSTRMNNITIDREGDLFSKSSNHRIIHSSDGGYNWTPTVQPLDPSLYYHNFVAADPFGNIYAFDYFDSYKSTDKGQTWQHINLRLTDSFNPNTCLFHPNGDIFELVHKKVHHYHADQDTSIWENTGIEVKSGVITAQGNLIFLADTTSWSTHQLYHYLGNGQVKALTGYPGGTPNLIAVAPNGLIFTTSHDSLFQSDNSGLLWIFAGKLPIPSLTKAILNIQVCNDQHLYISYIQDVIYRSTLPVATRNMITGVVWYDGNSNCTRDLNEPVLSNRYVQALGSAEYGGYSYFDGQYRVFAPEGTYQLSTQSPNDLFEACLPVNVTVIGQNDTTFVDVALRPAIQCAYLNVSASTTLLRRCVPNTYTVRYANEGSAVAVGATITVTLDSLFEFLSASIPPISQNGQVLTFQVGDLAPATSGYFQIQIKVSCMASPQQLHCFKAQISPGTPCLSDLADLSFSEECRVNIGPYDPNEKHAFVNGQEDPASVLPNQPIEYLINFQNTGTDTAFTVIVEDRIPGVLDIASVTPLVSSHPYSMELGPDRNLRFIFNNILLPDSNINEVASHGFIKFAIKQLPNLPSGTSIRNTAAIYFDFNAAVRTDPSELVVTLPTKVYEPEQGYAVQVFPNPFQDLLNFRISGPNADQSYTLLLMDALGRIAHRERFAGNVLQVSRKNLPAGIYFFTVLGENERRIAAGRVVAE